MATSRSSQGVLLLVLATAWSAVTSTPLPAPSECISPALIGSGSKFTAFPPGMRASSQASTQQESEVDFAVGFSIQYLSTYKVVKNKNADETYVLYQCGTEKPADSEVPEGAKVFQIPITAVSVYDGTALAFLDILGLGGRIKYVPATAVNPCMQTLGSGGCGLISEAPGGWGVNESLAAEQKKAVNAFFHYQGTEDEQTIAISASPEQGLLERAEWIKFVAAFFNMEPEANAYFEEYSKRYNAIKEKASAADGDKPSVSFVAWQPEMYRMYYNDYAIVLSFAPYKKSLIEAAGGQFLDLDALVAKYPDEKGRSTGTNGQFGLMADETDILREILKDVNVLVDESGAYKGVNAPKLEDFMNRYGFESADLLNIAALRNQQVYRLDARQNPEGFTSWYEGAVPRPDLVVLDLALALGDDEKDKAINSVAGVVTGSVVRNIETETVDVLKASSCPIASCALPTSSICPFVFQACDGSVTYADKQVRCSPDCSRVKDPVSDGVKTSTPPPPNGANELRPFLMMMVALVTLAAFLGL